MWRAKATGTTRAGSIPGSKHFGLWPLSEAAVACFGTPEWPADRVTPQASIEFDVADVAAVAAAGSELSVPATSYFTRRGQSRGGRRSPGSSPTTACWSVSPTPRRSM